MDVYLQPHSDDVCFSLGAHASQRGEGVLLTVFPISGYVPLARGEPPPPAEAVTRTRMGEDLAFCRACGLEPRFLDLPSSSFLGRGPFDLSGLQETRRRVDRPLVGALLALARKNEPGARSWLFCPSGVGGHVDHLAAFETVAAHYSALSSIYHVAFYEDLHYASDAKARKRGVERLRRSMRGRALRRQVLPLGLDGAQRKLALIRLYASQFVETPTNLAFFSPAVRPYAAAHEAIWSEEQYPHAAAIGEPANALRRILSVLPRVFCSPVADGANGDRRRQVPTPSRGDEYRDWR